MKKALDYLKSLGFKKPALQIWKFDLTFKDDDVADETESDGEREELDPDISSLVKSFQSNTLSEASRDELICAYATVLADGNNIKSWELQKIAKASGNTISEKKTKAYEKYLAG